jgi:hypothetical protein
MFPRISKLKIKQQTIAFAIVNPCDIKKHHKDLDMHYYKRMLGLEVFDLNSVQCLVGRVGLDRGWWVVFDRSGGLSRARWD